MEDKVMLTKVGIDKLKNDLDHLINVIRPEVIAELQAARAQGDLSENADYDAARLRQAQVESKIKEIESMLNNAEIIDDKSAAGNTIRLGSTVKILDLSDNLHYTYTIVGSVEADPRAGRISNASALAQAIIGRHAGERVQVKVAVPYDVEIIELI